MNSLLLRTVVLTGVLIGGVNIIFAGVEYGFAALPLWFYLSQLLLIPAMFIPMRLFAQASITPEFLRRAGLYALGWAVPYAIYKFAGDALNPAFSPVASLIGYLVTILLFAGIFAAIRKPK
ncbi:hypothetical protein SU48_04765 [Deinococcus puniceus]|uniref:Uncharacterized protein n=1 Tax=Deinococcus puniceus TaxID=1182568 RepID=A0A172T883_9DEIO|nr:hypothetical protein [Deinococcus puniceus]ANE43191.1 hypothetical protein SU48_04765 [Deinococcus puniceus]